MTTIKTTKKKLTNEEFNKKREDLLKQLAKATQSKNKHLQRDIRRQLLSDDLVP